MKESEFIDHNKDKWSSYEKLIQRKNSDPDALRDVFIQITDDLSYSRSHYPNRSVRVYLNHLARQIFDKLGKRKKVSFRPIVKFFTIEAPQLMYLARKEMLLSLVVFLLSVCIGIYSSHQDPDFAKQILGDSYVRMTETNIENGDPMAVYRSGKEVGSFLAILRNNAQIDILVLGLGMLFGVGALFVLVSNGIMLGVFQYYFYQHGGFQESVLTIWLHGTIEISTIALIGGVGIMAGKGLMFPGSYTRYQSFRLSAGNASKLLIAVLPFTVLAAVIEAFITGQRGTPDVIKVIFIILSMMLVAFYFIWLPIKVNRQIGGDERHEKLRNPIPLNPINTDDEKTIGQIVSEAFGMYRENLGKNVLWSFAGAFILTISIYWGWPEVFHAPKWGFLRWLQNILIDSLEIDHVVVSSQMESIGLRLLKAGIMSIMMLYFLSKSISTILDAKLRTGLLLRFPAILAVLAVVGISVVYFWADRTFLASSAVLYGSLYVLTICASVFIQKAHFANEVSVTKLIINKPFRLVLFFLALSAISIFILLLVNSILMGFFVSFLRELLPFGANGVKVVITGTRILIFYGIFFSLLPFFFYCICLQVLSITEEYKAPALKKALRNIIKT
jgi:uncharacterized membrane protein SpoIIM required for sporulation